MTTSRPVEPAIAGSTGQLGGMVARSLAESSVPQRLVVRSAERAPREMAEYLGSRTHS
jgi:predicted amino acid dehydrogenase